MKKKIALILTVLAFCPVSVNASVLGNVLKDSTSLPVGQGLTLYSNTYLSDQTGVGNQTEYYAEYTPNTYVRPVVMTGDSIYGKRNAKEAVEYMQSNNMVPMLGINASFFSFETGIPMGNVITNGTVTSKDNRTLPAIGFRSDGTGFIEDMYIETNAYFGENYVLQIPHINKYISKETQMLTLFTPEFGESTGTNTETLNVVLENISDTVKVGGELECSVKEIFTSDKPVKINDGEYVLSVNTKGNQWAITLINTLIPGEKIKIKTTANDSAWNEAYNALASDGERLLEKGSIAKDLEAGAAPRTAVGIKENGDIVFYVIDGRQYGYSYGIRKDSTAKRLKELGCVDAINLDGGGSTTMAGVYPGCDNSVIVNSPSEGTLRKVTNFIFLQNVSNAVGEPAMAYIYPYAGKILSGSTVKLETKTVDENYYPTANENISFSCNEYGKITSSGELTALGEGVLRVESSVSGLTASAAYNTIITPDKIKLYNADNSVELERIDVLPGDTIRLKAEAYYDGAKLISSNSAYRWTVGNSEAASVDENGILKISEKMSENTTLTVKAGAYSKTFELCLGKEFNNSENYPYSEISIGDGTLNIDMYSYNAKIDKDKSYVKLDGTKYSLSDCDTKDIDDKHINVKIYRGEGFEKAHHKVFVQTVLKNGYSSVNSYYAQNGQTENIFADTQEHWAKEIVAYMNKEGVVSGSESDGVYYYRPNDRVTRAEFAVMTAQYMGYDLQEYESVSLDEFEDKTSIPDWAASQIKAVYKNGIIKGKGDNSRVYFEPDSYITRAEAATVISRILPDKMAANSISYKDAMEIPDWAYRPIKVLSSARLMSGYSDNTIRPANNVTRAEAVTMFYNIY